MEEVLLLFLQRLWSASCSQEVSAVTGIYLRHQCEFTSSPHTPWCLLSSIPDLYSDSPRNNTSSRIFYDRLHFLHNKSQHAISFRSLVLFSPLLCCIGLEKLNATLKALNWWTDKCQVTTSVTIQFTSNDNFHLIIFPSFFKQNWQIFSGWSFSNARSIVNWIHLVFGLSGANKRQHLRTPSRTLYLINQLNKNMIRVLNSNENNH